MKPILFAAALSCVTAAAAQAQQRPSTTAMTCGQARAYVLQHGAAVLGTGGYSFDRFVSDRSRCEPTEVTKTTFVPTRDTQQCFIGYRCIEPSQDDWFGGN